MHDTPGIRHATLADVPAMAALLTQLGYPVEADAQEFYRGIGMAQTGRRFGKALG